MLPLGMPTSGGAPHGWHGALGHMGQAMRVGVMGAMMLMVSGLRPGAATAAVAPPMGMTDANAVSTSGRSMGAHTTGTVSPSGMDTYSDAAALYNAQCDVQGDYDVTLGLATASTSSSGMYTTQPSWQRLWDVADASTDPISGTNNPAMSDAIVNTDTDIGYNPAQPSSSTAAPGSSTSTSSDVATAEAAAVRLFQRSLPSVVNISAARSSQTFSSLDVHKMPLSQGSGVLWDQRGHCVTAYHCVKGAAEVKVGGGRPGGVEEQHVAHGPNGSGGLHACGCATCVVVVVACSSGMCKSPAGPSHT